MPLWVDGSQAGVGGDQVDATVAALQAPSAARSAFDESIAVPLTPVVAVKATYGLLDSEVQTFSATGGSVEATSGEFTCHSGTSVGGYGTIWTRRPIVYVPGEGVEGRITGRFSAVPAGNYLQGLGLFSAADGIMFVRENGRNAVMHRHGGEFAIRKLTITVAAGGAETVTVTLNGVAYAVSVAASATVAEAAHDLAAALAASAAINAWYINHIDDAIILMYRGTGPQLGTYSVASTGTEAGTFTTISTGVAPTEDMYYQSPGGGEEGWNGVDLSWFDESKGNLFRFTFAYLGYGPLKVEVYHEDTDRWVTVHRIGWHNNNTEPNLGNPSLRLGWFSASLGGSGTDVTVHGASAAAFRQGDGKLDYPLNTAVSSAGITTSETFVLSMQVRYDFGGRACLAVVIPSITVSSDSTKSTIFSVYINPAVGGDTNHQYIDEDGSVLLQNAIGTTVTPSAGSVYITSIGPSGRAVITAEDLGVLLVPGDEIVVTARVASGAASVATVTIVGKEIR